MPGPTDLDRRETGRVALVALVVFAIYACGACRTIYVGDSGELVTAVYLLGIPHPSGYPLYVLLGKLWTLLLPIGTVAFRMSLFSAAAAAAACGALYALGRALAVRPAAATFAAGLLAASPSFWVEATIQRVYALNALFVVLATLAAWRWCESGRLRALIAAFFLCGLGASNHTFMAIYAAALLIFALIAQPSLVRRASTLAGAGAMFLAGLLPYVYLPLRSRADPILDWDNPEGLLSFLRVVLRLDFWERRWLETPADLAPIAWDYTRSLGAELTWIGAGLAALGALAWGWRRAPVAEETARAEPVTEEAVTEEPVTAEAVTAEAVTAEAVTAEPVAAGSARRRRRAFVLLPLLVMAGNLAALAIHGSRTDIFIWHRYYIPSYTMGALLAGIGCAFLLSRLPHRLGPLALVLPAVLVVSGWKAHDRSRFRFGEEFSSLVLETLPPGAHLIAEDDNVLFTLMYLHFVEHRRPDVDLILQGVGAAELPPLKFDPLEDPLYFTHHPNWDLPGLEIVPMGLAFRAWRSGIPRPTARVQTLALDGESDPRVPKDYLTQNLIGQFHYMLGVTLTESDWPRAREEFRKATSASPENDVLWYNLGLIYRRNGLVEDALEAFRRSHEINPRHLANRQRPRASDKIAETEAVARRLEVLESELRAGDPTLHSLPLGSGDYHRRMAEVLAARGETEAARGHHLMALESKGENPSRP